MTTSRQIRRFPITPPRRSLVLALLAAMCWIPTQAAMLAEITVRDIFGRKLNAQDLVLVDWEGYLANPAIKFLVSPPQDGSFPATAVLSADNVRLYFDLPSQNGASGPTKTITFANASTQVPVLMSSFPDRDASDGHYHLSILFTGANGQQTSLTLDVHEIDQDVTTPGPYPIVLDFSKDQTGFFSDPNKVAMIRQAADDFAYFIDITHLDEVAAGAEPTLIWNPDGFNSYTVTTNVNAYIGFLLYPYGIHSAALRSGGEPSAIGGFQSSVGFPLDLKRSGGIEIETQGNFNTLGWFLSVGDHDWWVSGNLGNEQNDLYSIAHHEMGHAFAFNPSYPRFNAFKQQGFVQDAAVLAYHGSYPTVDASDHLSGHVDKASRQGAFGYEYFGDVPRRRWLTTKLDLLVAQAVGYTLRATSAFKALSLTTVPLPDAAVSQPYSKSLVAQGGIPFYSWTLDSGVLPAGMSLDAFTGTISGVPTQAGLFNFSIRVREYVEGTAGIAAPFSIRVTLLPGMFSKTFPPNGVPGLPPGQLTLSWTFSSGATSYEYCYDKIDNNSCDAAWISVNTAVVPLSGLSGGTFYFWQVRARSTAGTTEANAGAWWSFAPAVASPGAFGKITPPNGASVHQTILTLGWGSSSNATSYQYCLDTSNNNMCDAAWISTGSATSVVVNPSPGTYYWQVKALNGGLETEADGGLWSSVTISTASRLISDLNGDGIGDILLQDSHSTSVGAWLMNGAVHAASFVQVYIDNIGAWKIVGRDDLNGDGIGDILLQNSITTHVGAWLMNASGQVTSFIAVYFDDIAGWAVVGTADLNGDGIGDILLQDSSSTYVGAWLMNASGQPTSFVAVYFDNIDGWRVVGTADVNGDGIRDILLQDSVSTYVGAWLMNAAGQAASFIPVYFDNIGSWKVVGTEDLNGDGITDIILQNALSTYVGAWLMNGSGQAVSFVPFYFDNIGGWRVNGKN
jgi:putative Ig domain-containing protein/VCBS repeat protein